VYYNLQEIGCPHFEMVLDDFVKKHVKKKKVAGAGLRVIGHE